jgi:hypothetical protein
MDASAEERSSSRVRGIGTTTSVSGPSERTATRTNRYTILSRTQLRTKARAATEKRTMRMNMKIRVVQLTASSSREAVSSRRMRMTMSFEII